VCIVPWHRPTAATGVWRVTARTFAVKAVLESDREHVYQAALLDPNTAATLGIDDIRRMCDELLVAHGDRIPEPLRLP